MLCKHLTDKTLKILLKEDKIVTETKYDGERIMIHKNGNDIKFFTRNSNDYTTLYGPKYSKIILQNVKTETCILDGEFLIWVNSLSAFKPFGHNKTLALSEKEETDEQFCYIIFDILYVEGKQITDKNLIERRKVLYKIINEVENTISIVKQKEVTTQEEVFKELDSSIMKGDEGIIIKNLNYEYVPGERGNNWVKLKPDSIEGMGETLDLIILGGFYGYFVILTQFRTKVKLILI
jgi:DNA ligase 4